MNYVVLTVLVGLLIVCIILVVFILKPEPRRPGPPGGPDSLIGRTRLKPFSPAFFSSVLHNVISTLQRLIVSDRKRNPRGKYD